MSNSERQRLGLREREKGNEVSYQIWMYHYVHVHMTIYSIYIKATSVIYLHATAFSDIKVNKSYTLHY